jgi:hypothetical protein
MIKTLFFNQFKLEVIHNSSKVSLILITIRQICITEQKSCHFARVRTDSQNLVCKNPLIEINYCNCSLPTNCVSFSCQFHQHFYVQLFCTYIAGLYFFGVKILTQKVLIKCWWNWPVENLWISFSMNNLTLYSILTRVS